jgi:hypothetical protein
MTEQEVQKLIEQSPALQKLTQRISTELTAADPSFSFDPMLIIMIISIVVNVIIHCREKRNAKDIEFDMRRFRALQPRQLMRLKRRLNRLWLEQNPAAAVRSVSNPIVTAVYEIAAKLQDEEIQAVLAAVEK